MQTACKEHGTETRLRCVTCEAPICRRCLVSTKVGFKCPEHGLMAAAPVRQTPRSQPARRRSRPARFGMLPVFLIMFVGFPILTVGLAALFALTGDKTGFVALLPLLVVFVLLALGGIALGRRLTRS